MLTLTEDMCKNDPTIIQQTMQKRSNNYPIKDAKTIQQLSNKRCKNDPTIIQQTMQKTIQQLSNKRCQNECVITIVFRSFSLLFVR